MDERQTTKARSMKTLHLNLKRQWFDLILSGEKKEEYREIKDYWVDRFVHALTVSDFSNKSHVELLRKGQYNGIIWRETLFEDVDEMEYVQIVFSNGYSKNRDQFVIELKGIEIKEGREEWGAEPSTKYFAIQLGEITSRKLNK